GAVRRDRRPSPAQERSPEGQAGARQPALERAQVHGVRHHPYRGIARQRTWAVAHCRARYGHRHRRGRSRPHLRSVRAGWSGGEGLGRDGPRPCDLSSPCATPRRRRGGRERGRRGVHLRADTSDRTSDADHARGDRRSRVRQRRRFDPGGGIVRLKQREEGRTPASVARRAVIGRSLKSNGATRKARPVAARPIVAGREARGARATGKYVYCIIRAGNQPTYGPIGLGADPAEVYTIARGDLAAVVSDAPLEVLDPTRDNVLAHQRVNETVMKQDTVLPMSFGTVFKTHDDVVELLRSAADAFSD